MSFVHNIPLLMIVCSATFMRALQVFWDIFVTRVMEFSLSQWHIFYITILKIIYVYNDDIHNTYETYIRIGVFGKTDFGENLQKKQKKKRMEVGKAT